MRAIKTGILMLTLAGVLAGQAVRADDLPGMALTAAPAVDQWSLGGNATHGMKRDAGVPGGWDLDVAVAAAGTNPWDVQAGVATTQAIRKGDVILLAFWAKTVTPPAGQAAGAIIANVQQSHAPYTRVGEASLSIDSTWKLYYVSGTAGMDLVAGEAAATVQLAGAAQEIALGPVFVRDLGPGYDLSRLPVN